MPTRTVQTPLAASQSPAASGQTEGGRFIVLFGTKGGVGKTVVTTNLAVSFARRLSVPVCLIDLDPMAVGDVCKMLNVSLIQSIAELMPTLKRIPPGQSMPLESLIVRHPSGVHLISGISHPRQVGQLEAGETLSRLFQQLKRQYTYVIVDGGRAFSEPLICAFDMANVILLVVSPDIVTLYQTKWAMGLVESLHFPSSMVKIILNRAESRGSIGTQDVRVALPCEVIGEIPSDGRAVGSSVNQGVPVVTAFPSTRIAEAFGALTDTLITRANLYVSHHEIPRHRRADDDDVGALARQQALWSTRLYGEGGASPEEALDEIVLMKQRIHEQLVEELDLKRLDLATMAHSIRLVELRQKTERVVSNLLARETGGLVSSREVRATLVKEITDEALGFGPLEELLADPAVTDILVNNKDEIYIERHGKLEQTTKKFMSNDQVRTVIERIIAPLGRRIDESNPMVDARFPDGSRVNAIIPPLSVKGPVLSIRKFGRERLTLQNLIELKTLNEPMAQLLQACVLLRKNMIVSGGTGSGKTTLLNVLSVFIPDGERVITIEDSVELKLVQRHWISLEARPSNVEGRGNVTARDLFRNALRMRPDRIIIGECRGDETLDMLQAMNTGHAGSITTIHANSPRDVISRVDSMVLLSSVALPIRAIREMVGSAIQVLVHTDRLSDGSRKITAITELAGLVNDTELVFRDLFVFRQTGMTPQGKVVGDFGPTGMVPTFLNEVKVKGIPLDETIFQLPAHGE